MNHRSASSRMNGLAQRHHRPRIIAARKSSLHRRAMTLVEVMVVVVILGILATTVTISVRDYLVSGKQNAARQEVAQIVAALELYYLENNRYPTPQEGLAVLIAKTPAHPDGLLRGGDLKDPWGHPYEYLQPGLHGSFDVFSLGADGAEGGEGAGVDITSWQEGAP